MAAKTEPVSAQVFLRSTSGRSLRSLGQGPLPEDLAPFLPSPAVRREAVRALGRLGFTVHADDTGLSVSIEGPPSLFSRVFGVAAGRLRVPAATETVALPLPESLKGLVESVVLLPRPELFR